MLQQQLRQLIAFGQLDQHLFGRRGSPLRRLLQDRQTELLKQDLAKLLGGGQIELLTCDHERLLFQLLQPGLDLLALLGQLGDRDQSPLPLHVGKDRHQRQLDALQYRLQRGNRLQLRPQRLMQPQRDVGIFGGIGGGLVQFDLVEGELLDPLAGNLFEGDGLHPQILLGQGIHVMASGG